MAEKGTQKLFPSLKTLADRFLVEQPKISDINSDCEVIAKILEKRLKSIKKKKNVVQIYEFLHRIIQILSQHEEKPAIALLKYHGGIFVSYLFDLYLLANALFGEEYKHAISNVLEICSKNEIITEVKYNSCIDWLIHKIVNIGKNKDIFMSLCDAAIQADRSAIKTARLLTLFNPIIKKVVKHRYKYLPGYLFAIGGLLKVLGISYCNTKYPEKVKSSGIMDMILVNEEKEMVKTMPNYDLEAFEKYTLPSLIEGIKSLSESPMMVESFTSLHEEKMKIAVLKENQETYEKEQKENHSLYNQLESVHYTLLFLFDLLHYVQLLVLQPPEEIKLTATEKDALNSLSLTINLEKLQDFSPCIPHLYELIKEIISTVNVICTDLMLIYRFNQIFLHKPKKKNESGKMEGYERHTKYNLYGFYNYFYFSVLDHFNSGSCFIPKIYSFEYFLEICLPIIIEMFHFNYLSIYGLRLLNVILNQAKPLSLKIENKKVLNYIGSMSQILLHSPSTVKGIQNRIISINLLKHLFKMLKEETLIEIYRTILKAEELDGPKSYIINLLKEDIQQNVFLNYSNEIKTLINDILNTEKLIEMPETLYSTGLILKVLCLMKFANENRKELDDFCLNIIKSKFEPILNSLKTEENSKESKIDDMGKTKVQLFYQLVEEIKTIIEGHKNN